MSRRPGRRLEVGPFTLDLDETGVTFDVYVPSSGGFLQANLYCRLRPTVWTVLMVRNRRYGLSVSTTPTFGVVEYLWRGGDSHVGRVGRRVLVEAGRSRSRGWHVAVAS
jgi:hypothetical protein